MYITDDYLVRAGTQSVYGVASWLDSGHEISHALCTPDPKPTQPPTQRTPDVLSSTAKRLGREADQSHPSSAEVKNEWSCTSTSSWHIQVQTILLTFYINNLAGDCTVGRD